MRGSQPEVGPNTSDYTSNEWENLNVAMLKVYHGIFVCSTILLNAKP